MRPNSVTVFIALLCTTAVTGQDGVGAALRIGQVVCSQCECCGSSRAGSPCDGPCHDPCLGGEMPDTACTAFVLGNSGAAAAFAQCQSTQCDELDVDSCPELLLDREGRLCAAPNQVTSPLPPFGNLTSSLNVLKLLNNHLTYLPAEIGNLTSLGQLDASYNNLTSVPTEIGNLTSLRTLALEGNNLTTLSPWIEKLRLTAFRVGGNPNLLSYPLTIYMTAWADTPCSIGFSASDDGSRCESCDEQNGGPSAFRYLSSGVAMLIAVVGSAYIIWQVAGADWSPDCQSGDSCIVHFGRADTAHGAAQVWFEKMELRLQEDAGSVRLDHGDAEIARGDEVMVSDSNAKLGNLHGIVVEVDDKEANVSLTGKAGLKKLPLSELQLVPAAAQQPSESLPALCFCLGDEWCSAATFQQDVTTILGPRSGTQGCAFVVCGESVTSTDGYRWLVDTLQVEDEILLVVDEQGKGKDSDHAGKLMGGMEDFLEDQRAVTSTGLTGADSELAEGMFDIQQLHLETEIKKTVEAASQSARQMANLLKIVGAQLHQSLLVLTISLDWPEFVKAIGRYLRGLIVFDFASLVPVGCMDEGMQYFFIPETMLLYAALAVLAAWCVYYKADGQFAAHMSNFGWAIYTLLGASVLQAGLGALPVSVGTRVRETDMFVLWLIVVPMCVLIPLHGLNQMRKARNESRLRSRAFESRMGWLCARYIRSCYWFEFLYLEVRFFSMIIAFMSQERVQEVACPENCGEVPAEEYLQSVCYRECGVPPIDREGEMFQTTWPSGELAPVVWITPVTATVILSLVTVCMALLQFALKPFEETEKEADGGWRTSPNSQAEIAYGCQLLVMFCGVISSDNTLISVAVSLVVIVALFLPLVMTIYLATLTVADLTATVADVAGFDKDGDGDGDGDDESAGKEESFSNPLKNKKSGDDEAAMV